MDDGTETRPLAEIRPPWSRSDRPIPRRILRPLQEFLTTSTASGTILVAAVAIALVWANSPWGSSYGSFWGTTLSFRLGSFAISHDLRHWVNEGLMTLFFLVVGLEIKREVLTGELQRLRVALLPVIAAVTGMAAPALVYLLLAGDAAGSNGWAIPIATDIVLSLGVLALAGAATPSGLRSLLLALAIVDDIVTVLVVAVVSPADLEVGPLLAAAAIGVAIVVLPRIHVRASPLYVVLGVGLWASFQTAGVHPALAGVAAGLLTPAEPFQRPRAVSEEARRTADATSDAPEPPDADAPHWLRLADLSREAVSPLARVEHLLLPWTSFVIVPLFALANIGVELSATTLAAAAASIVAWAILAARTVGKFVGVWGGTVAATAAGVVDLPVGVRRRHVAAMAAATGAGFTVPLFVAELAVAGEALAHAKIALLVASVLAGAIGVLLLRTHGSSGSPADGVRTPSR